MRRLPVVALLASALALPAPSSASSALTFAGTGVHYCQLGLFGTSCYVQASSTTHCGGTTAEATVTCTVTVSGGYGIPRTEPKSSNPTCGASGWATVEITDSAGTAYPLVVGSLVGNAGSFEIRGVAGAAPDVTAVYARFTMTPMCGKQSGRLAGVIASG